MFELTGGRENWDITNRDILCSEVFQRVTVFTEQGVAMLSSVLRSKRAILVNIELMRAFVSLREMLTSSLENNGVTGPRVAARGIQATDPHQKKRTRGAPVHAGLGRLPPMTILIATNAFVCLPL